MSLSIILLIIFAGLIAVILSIVRHMDLSRLFIPGERCERVPIFQQVARSGPYREMGYASLMLSTDPLIFLFSLSQRTPNTRICS